MLNVAYFQAGLTEFRTANPDQILGLLNREHTFSLEGNQRDAWLSQIQLLQRELAALDVGRIFFEFAIPRMGKRADVVLQLGKLILVLEFKVGASTFDASAIDQVHDYALDLKNFHRGSHAAAIVPILVATEAEDSGNLNIKWAQDLVAEPICHSGSGLLQLIGKIVHEAPIRARVDGDWETSGYLPTPTIIEAAQALYQNHAVDEIARSDAGAQNLNATSSQIKAIVRQARADRQKSICFVTGVPGSGKTLAGLNIATASAQESDLEKAVFLSGNGPLVTVLREALARDQRARTGCKKKDALREVASFVQNIHHFRDEALRDLKAPPERVVIFDEAQRAWDRDQTSKFMQTKRAQTGFDQSEPEFLISVMDRHEDWCVIVCLVGGGQEINVGEAGLLGWLEALKTQFPDWQIHLSDRLADPRYGIESADFTSRSDDNMFWHDDLHLSVSMRSFRAETLSGYIDHILDNEPEQAARLFQSVRDRYPIVLTRDIDMARGWLRAHSRGTERHGLIASSNGYRLRPEGVNVRAKIDPANWFLNGPQDVRSAYYLEEVATEFDIQGLEIDWACVCWDGDLRYKNGAWRYFNFKGTKWQNVNAVERQLFLVNAYRVILTRARQGMVIFVPKGDECDQTRLPEFYDATAEYLVRCGIPEL